MITLNGSIICLGNFAILECEEKIQCEWADEPCTVGLDPLRLRLEPGCRNRRTEVRTEQIGGVVEYRSVKLEILAPVLHTCFELLNCVHPVPAIAGVVEMREPETIRVPQIDAEVVIDIIIDGERESRIVIVDGRRAIDGSVRIRCAGGACVDDVVHFE